MKRYTKKLITILSIVTLCTVFWISGSIYQIQDAFAAAVSGPTTVLGQVTIGLSDTLTVQKKGTYEVTITSNKGDDGTCGRTNSESNTPSYQGGPGGFGQSYKITMNLNVGDVLSAQTISGSECSQGGGSIRLWNGGTGGYGTTVYRNGAFLASIQGGGGGAGGRYTDSRGWYAGSNGGAGGVTQQGTNVGGDINNGGVATTALVQSQAPAGQACFINITGDIISYQNVNYTSNSQLITVKLVSEYVNKITSFAPITQAIKYNTSYADVLSKLPVSVAATCSYGTYSIPVSGWSCSNYDKTTAGTYTFTATLGTLPGDVTNPLGLAPTATVTMADLGQIDVFNKLEQLEIPTINCIVGKSTTSILPCYDDMDSGSSSIVTVINTSKADKVITVVSNASIAGPQVTSVNGKIFIVNGISEPNSTNVNAILN